MEIRDEFNKKVKQPLNILLIYPTRRTSMRPPLGLGYLGGVAKAKGCNVKIISKHTLYNKYSDNDILRIAKEFKADLIGMMVFDSFSPLGSIYSLAKMLRQLNVPIIGGGPHASIRPEELLKNGFDVVVFAEGELTFAELLDHYSNQDIRLEDIKGIYFNKEGGIVKNVAREAICDLDAIPFPAKELYDQRCYPDSFQFGNILTSRGCPGQCTYCDQHVFGRKFRFRSAENIFVEIKHTYDSFKCSFFVIEDDAFTVNKDLVNKLCDLIISSGMKISWWCQTRVDCISEEIMLKMKKAGCCYLSYGIESGDPETLKKIKKHIDLEKAKKVIKMTKDSGINCIVNFMYGFPWETTKNLDNTFRFIKEVSPWVHEFAAGGILVPYPGTDIYETYKGQYGFEDWWLKPEYYANNIDKLYNTLGYFPIGILQNDFFNYPKDVKKKIIQILAYIMHHNLRKKPFFERTFSTIFVETSIFLCSINPKLEKISLVPIFKALVWLAQIHKKHKKHYEEI